MGTTLRTILALSLSLSRRCTIFRDPGDDLQDGPKISRAKSELANFTRLVRQVNFAIPDFVREIFAPSRISAPGSTRISLYVPTR